MASVLQYPDVVAMLELEACSNPGHPVDTGASCSSLSGAPMGHFWLASDQQPVLGPVSGSSSELFSREGLSSKFGVEICQFGPFPGPEPSRMSYVATLS